MFNENTRSLEILSQLRELGIQISIDDFGTGYSSLSRLSYFPFDKIKIDRSFVINIPLQKDDLDIVRLIISMGKKFTYAYCRRRRRNRRTTPFAATIRLRSGSGLSNW
ncbi:Cyclic di-GMP phosphodiesterase Gmr [Raoultella planticola]|uniref:Cyclic di-GMP phosphodiesterase Gmr n=1 Tax=Raoultella planticola TaxID=575 RepID=A0A485D0J2_RAOPL|nr:Cyclic di-GMP phosphodiesterase Gmr [Raoultella planticola]